MDPPPPASRDEKTYLRVTLQLQFTNWAPRSPSLYLQEACVTVHSGGYNRKGKWNDLSCMEQRGFVCQTPAGQILINPNSLLQAAERVKN